jgi:hypothetical protein
MHMKEHYRYSTMRVFRLNHESISEVFLYELVILTRLIITRLFINVN